MRKIKTGRKCQKNSTTFFEKNEMIKMKWTNILKTESEKDIEEEVIETLKQLHEAALNQYIKQYAEKEDRYAREGVRITNKDKSLPIPKYILVLEEALMKLGYNLPKERKAGTHRYADVNTFNQIRQHR